MKRLLAAFFCLSLPLLPARAQTAKPTASPMGKPGAGPAAPPPFLLSASADSTVRLWSMDTLSNVVAYRGHGVGSPVWDVQWAGGGALGGGWFASASRDRTARLWCVERTQAVRMYAGHLSDVDVRPLLVDFDYCGLTRCSA